MQAGLGKSEAVVIAPKHSYWLLLKLDIVLRLYKKLKENLIMAAASRGLAQSLYH